MAEVTRNHDSEARVKQRVAARDAVDLMTEQQLRTTLQLIVADSFLLDDASANLVFERITKLR